MECPVEDSKSQITEQIILAMQFMGSWESVHPRVCWLNHTQVFIFRMLVFFFCRPLMLQVNRKIIYHTDVESNGLSTVVGCVDRWGE